MLHFVNRDSEKYELKLQHIHLHKPEKIKRSVQRVFTCADA